MNSGAHWITFGVLTQQKSGGSVGGATPSYDEHPKSHLGDKRSCGTSLLAARREASAVCGSAKANEGGRGRRFVLSAAAFWWPRSGRDLAFGIRTSLANEPVGAIGPRGRPCVVREAKCEAFTRREKGGSAVIECVEGKRSERKGFRGGGKPRLEVGWAKPGITFCLAAVFDKDEEIQLRKSLTTLNLNA